MQNNKPEPTKQNTQSGYIMLAVIGILTIAAAIATLATISARFDASQARTDLDVTRTRIGVETAVARAMFLIEQEDGFVADGRVLEFELDDLLIRIRLVADQGLIGLNTANTEFLIRFIERTVPSDTDTDIDVETLVDAILDWRDADDDPLPLGAESRSYANQGLPNPGNRDFVHVAELRRVLGMDDGLYAALAPYLSVTAQSPEPDPKFAPKAILELLDLPPSELETILENRKAGLAFEMGTTNGETDETESVLRPEDRTGKKNPESTEEEETSSSNLIFHAFIEVSTGNGISRAERLRIHGNANGYELYGRYVIDYGSPEQLFGAEETGS